MTNPSETRLAGFAQDHLTTEMAERILTSETRSFSNAMAKLNLAKATAAFTQAKSSSEAALQTTSKQSDSKS